jgi:hypothetical protein
MCARLQRGARWSIACAMALALLAACGGGGGGSGDAGGKTFPVVIGGTVSGLPSGASAVLQLNGGSDLALPDPTSDPGLFHFPNPITSGSTYSVTVLTQPTGAICSINNGNGTAPTDPSAANLGGVAVVGNISVVCIAKDVDKATTSSTAFAVLATDTARVAFIPTGAGVVATSIDGAALAAAASPIALSFVPSACSVDSTAKIVACIGFASTKVAILDVGAFAASLNPADIALREFDTDAPNAATDFAGIPCIVCGVATFAGGGRFALAAQDGYRLYAYPAAGATAPLAAAKVYAIPINMSFAADPTRNWIISADYTPTDPSRPTRALRLVDLSRDKVYVWTDHTDACTGSDNTSPACDDFRFNAVVSTTIDVTTAMVAMQAFEGSSQLLVDLDQALFNDQALTFDAPHLYVGFNPLVHVNADTTTDPIAMSGVLASPTDSWLFMVPRSSHAFAGVQALPSAPGTAGVFPTYTANPVFVDLDTLKAGTPCDGPDLLSGRLPLTQAYTRRLGDGADIGVFASDTGGCIVKVDLKALYEAPRDASDPTKVADPGALVTSGVLSYQLAQ